MATDLARLLQSMFVPGGQSLHAVGWRPAAVGWRPAADIYRIRGGWLVKFDLAGVRLDEVRVSVCGRRLTVEGTRRDWQIAESQCHYCMEIAYSQFERSIELPDELDRARVTTEYRDGMLLVRLALEETGS